MSRTGSCQCGAVQITAAADPITTRACWCKDCQKIAAGGATHNAFFKTEDVAITGEVRWHDVTAASGNILSRGFCPTCGTHLFAQPSTHRHVILVRISAFGETDDLGPRTLIWTADAPAWAQLDPALPHVAGQPPSAARPVTDAPRTA